MGTLVVMQVNSGHVSGDVGGGGHVSGDVGGGGHVSRGGDAWSLTHRGPHTM